MHTALLIVEAYAAKVSASSAVWKAPKLVDWYHPTVLLSALTSRRQRIMSSW